MHVFADVPLIVKLIRNNFLDYGFQLSGGSFVQSECVREIIKKSESDLRPTYRLNENNLRVTGTKHINVRKAVQLLSETASTAIDFYGNQGLLESKQWKSTKDFIRLDDAWIDLIHSRAPYDKKPYKDLYMGCN